VLGTFDLARGTDLARELEATYSRESVPGRDSAKKLTSAAVDLRAMIETRKSM